MKPVILITRPIDGSRRFAAALNTKCPGCADVIISPLLEVAFLTPEVVLPPQAVAVFTSEAGVAASRAVLSQVVGLRAICVGERTAEAARTARFDAVAAGGTLDALIGVLSKDMAGPLVYLRGRHISGDLVSALASKGIECVEHIVYEQLEVPLSRQARAALMGAADCIVPVFSARSAARLLADLPKGAAPRIVAMSAVVAEVFAGLDIVVEVAAEPTLAAMVAATCRSMREMPRTNPA